MWSLRCILTNASKALDNVNDSDLLSSDHREIFGSEVPADTDFNSLKAHFVNEIEKEADKKVKAAQDEKDAKAKAEREAQSKRD